jgi:hypothetical protein
MKEKFYRPQAPIPPVDPKENWDDRRKKEQTLKLARENKIAEMLYIETDVYADAAAEVVGTVWMAANNLTNTIPQKMPGISDQDRLMLRDLIVSELAFARSEVEKFVENLEAMLEKAHASIPGD